MNNSIDLATYYESLIERMNRDQLGRPTGLPKHDKIIYYVISTRCEMDMNGFESVFKQLLDEKEIQFLIKSLRELQATFLADDFEKAYSRLKSIGFWRDESQNLPGNGSTANTGFLEDIEDSIRESELLWEINDQLVALIPNNPT